MDTSIASAVVLPQESESPPPSASPPTSVKRRQSSEPEQDWKRRRLSGDTSNIIRRDSNTETDDATQSNSDRRRSSANVDVKERTRGKRLFGGLLGVLSQGAGGNTAQKRRAEIEKRQKAKIQLQVEEDDQRRKERQARLQIQRQKEQKRIDEEIMHLRHANLLSTAHFLYTKAEPRLYYKPWELTPEEEDRIDDQVAEAQATIDHELDEYEAEREQERIRTESRMGEENLNAHAVQRMQRVSREPDAVATEASNPANGSTNDSESTLPNNQDAPGDHANGVEAVNGQPKRSDKQGNVASPDDNAVDEGGKEALDDNGEEVLEAAEDTVIY